MISGRSSFAGVRLWSQSILQSRISTVRPELLYAVELRVVVDNVLATYEPKTDTLRVVKRLAPEDVISLRNALQLTKSLEILAHGPMLFLVGCFARNDILFGPRGYRRTLLEAGEVTACVMSEAKRIHLNAEPIFEFTDRDVDNVMEADGVEEGTVAAFGLGEVAYVE